MPSRQVIDAEIEDIWERRRLVEESLRNRGDLDPKQREERYQENEEHRNMLEEFYSTS